jgi:hypothetical protein
MRLPRSSLGWALLSVFVLASIVLVSALVVRQTGRSRLQRALEVLRASGGPELPPQTPEISAGGPQTAAWFAHFDYLEEGSLDSTREIETHLAEHASEGLATELRVLADALRIDEKAVEAERVEQQRDKKVYEPLLERLGGELPDARGSLEFARWHEVRDAADDLLARQVPFESWDPVSRAWTLTRPLAFAELLLRASELQELSAFDPPAARGIERLVPGSLNAVGIVSRALSQLLPSAALAGDTRSFVTCAAGMQACGRMFKGCWGLISSKADAWALDMACRRIRVCLAFLPPGCDLGPLEDPIAAWNPRADLLEALRRERAVGNELFLDFRAGTTEAARITDGKSLVERECLRLWLDHEHAGYLEMLNASLALAPRAPFELPGGLAAYEPIFEDIHPPRIWQVLRTFITPDTRKDALAVAQLEVQRQLTLLCFAAWRDPTSVAARLAATLDPFTGRPLALREEQGVLVFSSPGADSEPIEARVRLR